MNDSLTLGTAGHLDQYTFAEADLLEVPAEELKNFIAVVDGDPYPLPATIKVPLRSPNRALGVALSDKLVIRQIRRVAKRFARGDIDWAEIAPKTEVDAHNIVYMAEAFARAVKRGAGLVVIPPYAFPKRRGDGMDIDVSKQFRVFTKIPITRAKENSYEVMPAIVPIFEDWRQVSESYSAEDRWRLVQEMSKSNVLGFDFAIAFGAAVGVDAALLHSLSSEKQEKISEIISGIAEITDGKSLGKTDSILEIGKVIAKGNSLLLPFQHVSYAPKYIYGLDFGSVLYRRIAQAKHILSDDELLEELKRSGNLMTFCPLDAFSLLWPRTKRANNIFAAKDPKETVNRMCNFVYENAAYNTTISN